MAWRSYISISEAMKKSFQMQSIHALKCAEGEFTHILMSKYFWYNMFVPNSDS